MSTILDVAKLAGVSQGTVSNVLNGKGNVSSKKIRMVQDAAQQLGFTINERARMLRKGSSNLITVILPNIEFIQYREFYNNVTSYAQNNNYTTQLLISNDNPKTEIELIQKSKAVMAEGIVTLTSLETDENPYQQAGFHKVCFVERKPLFEANYIGFDYSLAGNEMAKLILKHGYHNVAIITASEKFSNENEYLEGMLEVLQHTSCHVIQVKTDILRISHSTLHLFDSNKNIDAIVTSNMGFAEKIHQLHDAFFQENTINIHTLSPIYTLPEKKYLKYELNYSLLGKVAAQRIIGTTPKEFQLNTLLLENDGERHWQTIQLTHTPTSRLNVLTLEGPEAILMKSLAKLYTEKTGTQIHIAVLSYNEIYERFVNSEISGLFDVLRLDMTWLSWFSNKILRPLEELDPTIRSSFVDYLPSLSDKYSIINKKVYALPFTPCAQLLFYRKDLFENVAIKRIYRERYREELNVPKNFQEFNQIAQFFTEERGYTPSVRYGTSLALGNTGIAATEFLTRYFSHRKNLCYQNGKIVINDEIGKKAMDELIQAKAYASPQHANWWTSLARTFADGELAMAIMFSNYASEILASHSKIIGNVGFHMVPGSNPIVGGGSLGISRNSKHPEDALSYIKWMTREPISSAMAGLGSVSPCAKTYSKYDIIDTFPWLELSKDCFTLSQTRRIPDKTEKPFNEKKFLNIIGAAVKNVSMGFISITEALDEAQQLLDKEL